MKGGSNGCHPLNTFLCAGSSSLQPAVPLWPPSVSTVGSDTRWDQSGVSCMGLRVFVSHFLSIWPLCIYSSVAPCGWSQSMTWILWAVF